MNRVSNEVVLKGLQVTDEVVSLDSSQQIQESMTPNRVFLTANDESIKVKISGCDEGKQTGDDELLLGSNPVDTRLHQDSLQQIGNPQSPHAKQNPKATGNNNFNDNNSGIGGGNGIANSNAVALPNTPAKSCKIQTPAKSEAKIQSTEGKKENASTSSMPKESERRNPQDDHQNRSMQLDIKETPTKKRKIDYEAQDAVHVWSPTEKANDPTRQKVCGRMVSINFDRLKELWSEIKSFGMWFKSNVVCLGNEGR